MYTLSICIWACVCRHKHSYIFSSIYAHIVSLKLFIEIVVLGGLILHSIVLLQTKDFPSIKLKLLLILE